jgi:hypothetical protein
MIVRRSRSVGRLWLLGLLLPLVATAQQTVDWNQARVTVLAGELHEGVKGLRDEIRGQTRDTGSMRASAYYRLVDSLRLIERESRYLHNALESGASREETLPTYARIAVLRRDCAEEMERQPLGKPALERIARARSIVEQIDPYYGFDPKRPDHEQVLRR